MSARQRFNRIVEHGMCTSCGLCQSLAGVDTIAMCVQPDGNYYPAVVGPLDDRIVDQIYDVCPGSALHGLPETQAQAAGEADTIWGPYVLMQKAWAAEPGVRTLGSTGGVMTALGLYLVEQCEDIDFVLHVKGAGEHQPTFGERCVSIQRDDILAAAGSRYGPTAPLIDFLDQLATGRPFAFIGKPCDVSAIRGLAKTDPRIDRQMKACLSLVCGGFQPPATFNAFIEREGLTKRGRITRVKYRGNGCPGPTVVGFDDGSQAEMTYNQFWGPDESTWGVPWRCKLCADGIGDGADIAVADDWIGASPPQDLALQAADPGSNACIVRTQRGLGLWEGAVQAGYLCVGERLDPRYMDQVQPHQVKKKKYAKARYEALGSAGRIAPTTRADLRLDACAQMIDTAQYQRQLDGTLARLRAGKGDASTPVAGV